MIAYYFKEDRTCVMNALMSYRLAHNFQGYYIFSFLRFQGVERIKEKRNEEIQHSIPHEKVYMRYYWNSVHK